ncbi:MAG: UDP-N-acetylmuramate dehydrogenase [Bacteroidales bacterium]
MLTTYRNISLKQFNTFNIDAKANTFYKATNINDLKEAIRLVKESEQELLVLGGGSNILFKSDYNGAIVHPSIKGIEILTETDDNTTIKVGAGVEWDKLVEHTVNMGIGGFENLSLIPGNVGASPIQNIGAYGVEAKDSIEKVCGIFTDNLETFELNNKECKFGYRDSIFKNELKGKIIVTHVTYKLNKKPTLITHYGNMEDELEALGGASLQNVRNAVINIRNAKLPDPEELGNAGSFFKNPIVDVILVKQIGEHFDNVPFYPVNEKFVKLPAGWLIDKCGWKGKRVGNVGVHKNQALVLVNYGGATGEEVINLAQDIRKSVLQRFNIPLEMEVNMV